MQLIGRAHFAPGIWRWIVGVIFLSACSVAPDANPTASLSASPSPASSLPASVPPVGLAGGLAPDRVAAVVTNDLVVRSMPEISAESIQYPIRLSEGKLLFVLDGPVAGNGYDWYQVVPFEEFISDIPPGAAPAMGWVAAGRRDEAWIAPWTGECPPEEPWVRPNSFLLLACFGDRELTLEGTFGDCSTSVPFYNFTPVASVREWCNLLPLDLPSDALDLGGGFQVARRDSGGPQVNESERVAVRVVGHFDDPAARMCLPGEDSMPPELVVLVCRTRFVATDVTEIAPG
jgi:hypothetical protein